MAMVINTNLFSLNAQKNLTHSQGSLQTSMQRLSSGLRINSAKDDAAGLAIAQRMTTQIRGMTMAIKNSNDGISFAQTAESNLEEVSTALQRIRELAVQSANGIYTSSDRRAYQKEASQLQNEIGRILKTANFNGQAVFYESGTNIGLSYVSSFQLQVGANSYARNTLGATVSAGLDPNRMYFNTKEDYSTVSANGVQVFTGTTRLTLFQALASARIFGYSMASQVVSGGKLTGTVSAGDVISISTQSGARFAINWVDRALDVVNDTRATFGALQNRLESSIRNLENVNEALTAARSRLQDADFAAETASMTRSQILQQAGMSMLAQANQQPQSVMSLLQ